MNTATGPPDPVSLIHGDCLAVLPKLEAGSVDCVVTDPPYGIGYEAGSMTVGKATRAASNVEWDSIAGDEKPDGRWLTEAHRVMRDGAALYLSTRWDVEPEWRGLLRAAGFRIVQRLTWHKRVTGRGDLAGTYAPSTEDVLFASKGRHLLNKRFSSLLDVGCVPTWERRHHPHQKPVALPKLLIEASTKHGDLILDPFAGSGSTLVACMKTGRRGIGIEIDGQFIEPAKRRLDGARTPLFAALAD